MIDQWGQLSYDKQEPTQNLTHWIFDADSFVPTAKIKDAKTYSIVSDYLGSPHEMYDEAGKKVWEAVLDIYGRVRTLSGDKSSLPFRYQGQYEDVETGLCYNRFRYYSSEEGMYISQDPIGLNGGITNLYAYVSDPNIYTDIFGLQGTGTPFQVGLHKDLIKINGGTGLDSHHFGQKAIMKDFVANYDKMNAPTILVPTSGHTSVDPIHGRVSTSRINPKTGNPIGSARELLARDIRELRRVYPEIPNSKLQELIDLNKSMYPEMNKPKPKTGCH